MVRRQSCQLLTAFACRQSAMGIILVSDWLTDSFTYCTDWLTHLLTDWLTHLLTGWLTIVSIHRQLFWRCLGWTGCVSRVSCWLSLCADAICNKTGKCPTDWFTDWLTDGLIYQLSTWLADWLLWLTVVTVATMTAVLLALWYVVFVVERPSTSNMCYRFRLSFL